MKIRKLFALLAAAALAIGLLTGCGGSTLSSEAASAANAVQGTNLVIRFRTGSELDKALTQALREGHDMNSILDALCQALGLEEGALRLTAENLTAQAGQRVVELYAVRGASSADAAAAAANLLDEVLSRLTGGKYTGRISMEESGGVYYVAVDITVQEPGRLTSSGGGGSNGGGSSGATIEGGFTDWGDGGTTTDPGEGGGDPDPEDPDEGKPITVTIPSPPATGAQPSITPINPGSGEIKVFASFDYNTIFADCLESSGLQDVLNKDPYNNAPSLDFTDTSGLKDRFLSTRLSNALQSWQGGTYESFLEALDNQYSYKDGTDRKNLFTWERLPIERLEYAIKYHKYIKETAANFYSFVVVSGDFTKGSDETENALDQRAAEALFTELYEIINRYTSEGTDFGENNVALGKYFYFLDKDGKVIYDETTNKPVKYSITYPSSGLQEVGLVRVKEGDTDTYHYYAAVCVVANKSPVK